MLIYVYSIFSPYRIADYISGSLPAELTSFQLVLVLALAIALMVGKRRTLSFLLLAFGAFEGYVVAASFLTSFPVDQQTALLLTVIFVAGGAYLVYRLSRLAITAYLALTIGSVYLAVGGSVSVAPFVTLGALVVLYLLYRYVSYFVAALLGSVLLLLFLIQLHIPGFTPYLIAAASFSVSVTVRYLSSRLVSGRGSSRRSSPARARN